jgi:hypothetical protein
MTGQSDECAATYIRENFQPGDRLAIVLVNKKQESVVQRLANARAVVERDFLQWLSDHNQRGHEVYISMNTVHAKAMGRRKADIAEIRHVYLDFDMEAASAIENLLKCDAIPRPNYLVRTSPDKWQVIWKVAGFAKDEAETLQRELAWMFGADPAAVDCARVLRLPGYLNHKYAVPHRVSVEALTQAVSGPENFELRILDSANRRLQRTSAGDRHSPKSGQRSQSEKDWAYAKGALARGEPAELVAAAIAQHRRYTKPDPVYYANLTVRKAAESLMSTPVENSALYR